MIEALSRGGGDDPEAEHLFGRGLRELAGQVRRALAPVCGMSTRLTSRPERSQRRALALAALHVPPASSLEAQQKSSPASAGKGVLRVHPTFEISGGAA
jgi:hypothetical protein